MVKKIKHEKLTSSLVAQMVENLPAMQETQEMQVPSLGQEEPLEKQWQSLQYSCLENPMDGGAWWASVHGVAGTQTRLKQLSSSSNKEPLDGSERRE